MGWVLRRFDLTASRTDDEAETGFSAMWIITLVRRMLTASVV
jgi:hypothetical protein